MKLNWYTTGYDTHGDCIIPERYQQTSEIAWGRI